LIDCVTVHSLAQSQENNDRISAYRAVRWDPDDGLRKIRWHSGIIKDVNGFVWFGSNHGELSRFDGNSFRQYYPDKNKSGAVAGINCLSMVEDSLHNLWIGTGDGMSRYDIRTDTFTNFKHRNSDENEQISVVPFWACRDVVYCVESTTRITSYNVHTFERKKLLDLKPSDSVSNNGVAIPYAVYDAASNSVFMLFDNGEGLAQFFLATGKRMFHRRPMNPKPDGSGHLNSEAMCYDRKRNCIWINSHDGLFQFNLGDKQFHKAKGMDQILADKNYSRMVGIDIDQNGKIWFATSPEGLLIYDPEQRTIVKPLVNSPLQQATAEGNLKIYCAADGMVWLSYWSLKGIYQIIPHLQSVSQYAETPHHPDSLSSLNIQNMVNAGDGNIWLGTGTNGLNIFNIHTNRFKHLNEKDFAGMTGVAIVPMVIDTIRKKAWLNAGPPDKVYVLDMATKRCAEVIFQDNSGKPIKPVNIINFVSAPFGDGCIFFDAGYGLFEIRADEPVARLVIPHTIPVFRLIIVGD
jgi:hypothetical protein